MSSTPRKDSSGEATNGSPLLVKNLLKPEPEVIVSSTPMSPSSSDGGLPLMGPSNLEIRIPNESPASSTCSTSFNSSPTISVTNTSSPAPGTSSPAPGSSVNSKNAGNRNYPLLYAKKFFADQNSDQNGFIVVPDWLQVVSYDIPEGSFETGWQKHAYEVFLMQLSLKEASKDGGLSHEGSSDVIELHEDEAQAPPASRDEIMLKDVLQLESWPEIYRIWKFCWKLPNGTWQVPSGLLNPSGSQKLPQPVSRLPTWKALRNQCLRMMNIDGTPFEQNEFEVLRKWVKMEHEEQIAKGWIVVMTLKEQKELGELGEPPKKRFKEAQIMAILEKFSKKSP
ncbi:hypothetical protein B9Z55_007370 [Caenorhabditis nigoni]|uniref:Uncharacterized protein n=2 Tax=Caenorhabditis nigoni TaxID=1611254 RepID=A0A2G5V9C0_9PELO|nr:hypothetical protein B9Z55_007370 [Caenorhabditis nigoni]